MFTIELLPAARGDCIWVEYGTKASPRRILIDGGLVGTHKNFLRPKIEALPEKKRKFELLVVSHIDLDHISGIIALLQKPPKGLEFGDIWFNGYDHLIEDQNVLGAKQGEVLSELIVKNGYPWNSAFGGKAVCLPAGDAPKEIPLADGMMLTLMGPTRKRLKELEPVWRKEVEKAGMLPGSKGWKKNMPAHPEDVPDEDEGVLGKAEDLVELAQSVFTPDSSEANGSSIAFLAEYGGKRAFFTGDAFADDMEASVRKVLASTGEQRLKLDALKLSHHGGKKNTSLELLQLLQCKRYLFSTNGTIYKHPHQHSVARAIFAASRPPSPTVAFNYDTKYTKYWKDTKLEKGKHKYTHQLATEKAIDL